MKNKVLQWADKKGILKEENKHKQLIKLMEEVGELSSAILKSEEGEIEDAIGDIGIVMIILANQLGYDFDECIEKAYKVIENRTGKTVNGIFVRDKD